MNSETISTREEEMFSIKQIDSSIESENISIGASTKYPLIISQRLFLIDLLNVFCFQENLFGGEWWGDGRSSHKFYPLEGWRRSKKIVT